MSRFRFMNQWAIEGSLEFLISFMLCSIQEFLNFYELKARRNMKIQFQIHLKIIHEIFKISTVIKQEKWLFFEVKSDLN